MCVVLPFPTLLPHPLASLTSKFFPTACLQGTNGPRSQRGASGTETVSWQEAEDGEEGRKDLRAQEDHGPRGPGLFCLSVCLSASVCLPVSDSLTSLGTLASIPGAVSFRLLRVPRCSEVSPAPGQSAAHRLAQAGSLYLSACAPPPPLLCVILLLSGTFLHPWGLQHCTRVACLAQGPHWAEQRPQKDTYLLHPGCVTC